MPLVPGGPAGPAPSAASRRVSALSPPSPLTSGMSRLQRRHSRKRGPSLCGHNTGYPGPVRAVRAAASPAL